MDNLRWKSITINIVIWAYASPLTRVVGVPQALNQGPDPGFDIVAKMPLKTYRKRFPADAAFHSWPEPFQGGNHTEVRDVASTH